jgi:hypothetical protein
MPMITGKRALDFGLYILIALTIGIVAVVYAFTSPSDENIAFAIKWVSLLTGTAIVFREYLRKALRRDATLWFWLLLLCLLVAHFVFFVAAIYHWPKLKLLWLFLFMWVESVILSRLIRT